MTSAPVLLNAVAFRAPRKICAFGDAVQALATGGPATLPRERDLRAGRRWWTVREQPAGSTSSLALALADSVIRWHLVETGRLRTDEPLSPGFLEMASDLTGEWGHTRRRLRAVLEAARRFGCVREADLSEAIGLPEGEANRLLFARATRYRIATYISLGADDFTAWRRWLVRFGPILTWLHVDRAWQDASATRAALDHHEGAAAAPAQAVAVVGYRADGRFIVRNSWGSAWGDGGHAYVSEAYARAAFMEGYGLAV